MSDIQWTTKTFNPTTGCTEVGPECFACYSKDLSPKLKKKGVPGYENGFNFTIHPERLDKPEGWSGEYVFTCSMSDLFHERCPANFITDVFDVMHSEDSNVYQILTKRPERYVEMDAKLDWSEHIWAGTSVGVSYTTDRIDSLRECGAEVTFVSFEPLIEDIGDVNLDGVDWAIIGGERGAVDPDDPDVQAARELNPEWVRDLIRQCREQDTAVFVKQMGSVWAEENDASDWKGGHPYDWPANLRIREVPRIYPEQPEIDPWP